jgi:type VI secretion system lysozyme-like protein
MHPPDSERTAGIHHSLLDRLIGLPDGRSQPRVPRASRTQREERIRRQVEEEARRSHRQAGTLDWIIAAVKEDLRCLLSASRPIAFEKVAPADPIHRSLLTYGLSDLSDRTPPEIAAKDLLPAAIRDAIARFEPRLVDVHVQLEKGQPSAPLLRLRITAKLVVARSGMEPINLNTVVYLGSRKIEVNGGLDGGEAAPALPA